MLDTISRKPAYYSGIREKKQNCIEELPTKQTNFVYKKRMGSLVPEMYILCKTEIAMSTEPIKLILGDVRESSNPSLTRYSRMAFNSTTFAADSTCQWNS